MKFCAVEELKSTLLLQLLTMYSPCSIERNDITFIKNVNCVTDCIRVMI